MHRLLVVDDEVIIADGLYEVLQGVPDLDLDIYKAYSGDEAVELFDRTRFDIVLTDIRMPGMDGLELLAKIRSLWPKCRVIFLTGYHEFNYVYSAIQHNGVYYLLKTEGYDRVIQTVRQAVKDIEEEWHAEELLKRAREQADKARELMRNELFKGVLEGSIAAEEITQEQFAELDVPLRAKEPVLLLIGRIPLPEHIRIYSDKMKLLYQVQSIAHSYLETHAVYVNVKHGQSDLVWVVQPRQSGGEGDVAEADGDPWLRLHKFLKGNLELVQRACCQTVGVEMSLILDTSPVHWAETAERFAQLKLLMNYRIGRSQGLLLDTHAAVQDIDMFNRGRNQLRARPAMLDMLAEQLEHGRKADFDRTLREVLAPLKELDTIHHTEAQELYYSVSLIFLSYMNKRQVLERAASLGLHKLMDPEQHDSWPDAIAYLQKLADLLFELQDKEEEQRAHAIVSAIQKHIQQHLHDPDEITLVRLAELAFFNPSYLSRLFKQVTGINLSEYIADARLNKAKRLLADPNIKIQEVAEQVGYGTATNFTRSFRKATNMTPQEYRASLIK